MERSYCYQEQTEKPHVNERPDRLINVRLIVEGLFWTPTWGGEKQFYTLDSKLVQLGVEL